MKTSSNETKAKYFIVLQELYRVSNDPITKHFDIFKFLQDQHSSLMIKFALQSLKLLDSSNRLIKFPTAEMVELLLREMSAINKERRLKRKQTPQMSNAEKYELILFKIKERFRTYQKASATTIEREYRVKHGFFNALLQNQLLYVSGDSYIWNDTIKISPSLITKIKNSVRNFVPNQSSMDNAEIIYPPAADDLFSGGIAQQLEQINKKLNQILSMWS